jgi:tRNA pseudouridine38-40 synthase
MAAGARILAGEHDFTSFAAAGDSGTGDSTSMAREEENSNTLRISNPEPQTTEVSMVRTIFSSRLIWRPRTSILAYEVRGSGFLHHMVRNIVGTLIEVGRGKLAPADVVRILRARDRSCAGPTAPASGLCLMKVEY